MSVTTPFSHPRPFPFTFSAKPSTYDYVGGLTLDQVRQIWWNTELISVASAGTYEDEVETFADVNLSGDFPDGGVGSPYAVNALFDGDGVREPRTRVTVNSSNAMSLLVEDTDGEGNSRFLIFEVRIGIDPDDPAMFAVFYHINIQSGTPEACVITNPSYGLLTGTPESTGTFMLGAAELTWIGGPADFNTGAWVTGGTGFNFNVTPAFFTYP